MALTVTKRPRPSRSAKIRPSTAPTSRLNDLLRDQSLLMRWLLAVAGVAALTVAVQAWESPFPHRLGDYSSDGIAAKVAFGRVNEYDTEATRRTRANQVSPIFQLNSDPLDALPGRLRHDLEQLAAAPNLDAVPAPVRTSFGLRPPETDGATPLPDDRITFEKLQAGLQVPPTVETERPEDRIGDITDAFAKAVVVNLKFRGVLTADELKRADDPAALSIGILRPGLSVAQAVTARDVLLPELLREKTDRADEGAITRYLTNDPRVPNVLVPAIRHWLRTIPATLTYDDAATKRARQFAREAVAPVENRYNPRDIIIDPGSRIDDTGLEVLRAEYQQFEGLVTPIQRGVRVGLVVVMIGVLAILIGYYLYRSERVLFSSPRRLAVYLTAVVLTLAIGRFLSFDPWRAEVIPLTATAMILAIAYDQVLATITAFGMTALLVLSTTGKLTDFVTLISVASAAIIPLSVIDSRSKLIKVGFLIASVSFAVALGLGLLQRQSFTDIWTDHELVLQCLKGAGWCVVVGYLVAGSLPFVESMFGVVTDISLLEMSDVSHPLLQELVRRAPGTYNHSMAVASIGETAADAIGANGLLLRVGAYFHDSGKMLKPHYFIENMTDGQKSRHLQLNPQMSALIIIGHVKDGVDLAREHNLPSRIIDFIEQHHGTTLVEYFFREASRQADQSLDHKSDAEESAFRYPGPKPRSKETAVMMLSDAVESASRTLSEPTPKRIEGLVHGISMKRLLDGQFDESGLTLNEIRVVEQSLVKSLIGIYHGRIKYPDQKD